MIKTNKSLEQIIKENPSEGMFACLAQFVYSKDYSEDVIVNLFDTYMPKGDYKKAEKDKLLEHLFKLNEF